MKFDASGYLRTGQFDETWTRYVVKMATGSGKTKVLSLILAWSYFHKLYEEGSDLARNFLLITPNIIVLDRIRADFDGLKIFFEDPILPDNGYEGQNWQDDFQMTLHVQDEILEPSEKLATYSSPTFIASTREPRVGELRGGGHRQLLPRAETGRKTTSQSSTLATSCATLTSS